MNFIHVQIIASVWLILTLLLLLVEWTHHAQPVCPTLSWWLDCMLLSQLFHSFILQMPVFFWSVLFLLSFLFFKKVIHVQAFKDWDVKPIKVFSLSGFCCSSACHDFRLLYWYIFSKRFCLFLLDLKSGRVLLLSKAADYGLFGLFKLTRGDFSGLHFNHFCWNDLNWPSTRTKFCTFSNFNSSSPRFHPTSCRTNSFSWFFTLDFNFSHLRVLSRLAIYLDWICLLLLHRSFLKLRVLFFDLIVNYLSVLGICSSSCWELSTCFVSSCR